MRKRAVIGIFNTPVQAERCLDRLRDLNFLPTDISVLVPDKEGIRDFVHQRATKAPEGATTGATTGGVLGGIAGWLVGIGSLAIPGVGPFIAAGPIMAALGGAAIGAAAGGVAGGLIGMGIPEYEAKQYQAKIDQGGILVSVHCENSDEVARAKEVMEQCGATDISSTGEEDVPYRKAV
ncbi:MAG TPA: hypothetical protein VFA47_14075 [Candidatus Manganitrophaceae bacterium]|nr:hypothetical protein [Candidatus Manganitrophaceae bacterium]